MTNMDPRQTTGSDGSGATMHTAPDTFGDVEQEFEPDRGFDGLGGADRDGDGDIEIDETRWDSLDDKRESEQRMREIEAEQEAAAEAAQLQRAQEQAAREEAHANGEPYHEGSGTHEGEPVEIFSTPNGETVMVDEDGEVVAVAFPSEPVFMGYVTTTDGTMQLFELHDGSQVVVQDGQLVGSLDDVELATVSADVIPDVFLPPDTLDGVDEFYLLPMGPPSYDTQMVDAATGESFHELDTGTSLDEALPGIDGAEDVATYQPPGTDYTMHIQEGEVVNVVPIEEDPEWSFLGIVEVYEDGTVSIDLAVVEVDVDLVGPEKGISVGVDLFFIEVGAGVEWDTDGNWDFDAYVDVDFGAVEWGGDFSMSMDGDEFTAAVNGYLGVQMGSFEAGVEGGLDVLIGPDGVEVGIDAAATASGKFMGTEVDLRLEGGVDVGPGGVEGYLGANGALESELFGSFEAGASWNSEDGFDSYAGTIDGEGGAAQGLDMGWADELADVHVDGEGAQGDGSDGAQDVVDAGDMHEHLAAGVGIGRHLGDDEDGAPDDDTPATDDLPMSGTKPSVIDRVLGDGDDQVDRLPRAGRPDRDDVADRLPGQGRVDRDDVADRPAGQGRVDRDDVADRPAGQGRVDRDDALVRERPNVRDVFDDIAETADDAGAALEDGQLIGARDASRVTPEPDDEPVASVLDDPVMGSAADVGRSVPGPVDLVDDPVMGSAADVGRSVPAPVDLVDDPITAAPASPPDQPLETTESEPAPVEPEPVGEPVVETPPPAPEPAPEPIVEIAPVEPIVEPVVEAPPLAPEPAPEPPPIEEPEPDFADGSV